ncbi:hypothetical protein ACFV99_12620 [Streptomyces sp. NPDC059944]|uniref:hypothetical protein n=1 Tax=unclassified Streptomyces TaxID=2593676 RepID=UPI00365E8159
MAAAGAATVRRMSEALFIERKLLSLWTLARFRSLLRALAGMVSRLDPRSWR